MEIIICVFSYCDFDDLDEDSESLIFLLYINMLVYNKIFSIIINAITSLHPVQVQHFAF